MMSKFWKIKNKAADERAEILIYGEITEDATLYRELLGDDSKTSAKLFADDLAALGNKAVTIRINSPGGDVFQAQAIYNLLKAYKGDVTCHIDGICASAATIIACAADSVTMPKNALYMIHNPSIYMDGSVNAAYLEKTADTLHKVRDSILSVYQQRTAEKVSDEAIIDMMDNETWMTAEEALEYGFIDGVDDYSVAAMLTDGNVLTVNGLAMPKINNRQQEILQLMTPKKKEVNSMSNNEVLEKIMALLTNEKADKKAAEAAAQEKARIEALDALTGDNEYMNALIETAKAQNGTAEQLKPYLDAVAAVEPTNKAMDELKALIEDQLHSGADNVKPQPTANPEAKEEEKRQAGIDTVVALVNGKRG